MAYTDETTTKINEVTNAGFTVTYTDPNIILLDLDTTLAQEQFAFMFSMVNDKIPGGIEIVDSYNSKSGIGEHVVLKTKHYLTMTERLLFQCILGSDVKRELLSWTNMQKENRLEDSYISILFKPPEAKSSTINIPNPEPDYF